MNFINIIKNLLKGSAIGVANVIPGVSGGTIALILGIYEKLLMAVGDFFIDRKNRKKYFFFLLQIFIGMVIGIVIFAKLIGFAYEKYPQPTSFLFLGLISASIPFIATNYENKKDILKIKSMIFIIFGIILVIATKFINIDNNSTTSLARDLNLIYGSKLFICGAFAAAAMIIPGISGSFLLMVLGEYHNIINMINQREIKMLFIVAMGAGTGIIIFSKIISVLLKRYRLSTFGFIIGLVVGSLVIIYPGFTLSENLPILNISAFFIGYMAAYVSGKISK